MPSHTGVLGTLSGGLALDCAGSSVRSALLLCALGTGAGCLLVLLGFALAHSLPQFGLAFGVGEYCMFIMAVSHTGRLQASLAWFRIDSRHAVLVLHKNGDSCATSMEGGRLRPVSAALCAAIRAVQCRTVQALQAGRCCTWSSTHPKPRTMIFQNIPGAVCSVLCCAPCRRPPPLSCCGACPRTSAPLPCLLPRSCSTWQETSPPRRCWGGCR